MATTPAESADAAAERAIVLAEARILVERLAVYTDLMNQWAREDYDDAEQ